MFFAKDKKGDYMKRRNFTLFLGVFAVAQADAQLNMAFHSGTATARAISDRCIFDGDFEDGANYVTFTGLSGSSFRIAGNPAGAPRSAINGIQIYKETR